MPPPRPLFLSAALLLLCAAPAAAQVDEPGIQSREEYERALRQPKLGSRYIPKDLDDAMATLDALTAEDSKDRYAAAPEDEVVHRLFFSFGRWIATNWGLYDGSRLQLYLRRLGVDQPDGQVEFLMRAYHRHLNGADLDVRGLATAYRAERARRDSAEQARATVLETIRRPAPRPPRDTSGEP